MSTVTFSIVVPVFNEEAVLPRTYSRLRQVLESMGEPYEIVFVDDGSTDQTPALLAALATRDPHLAVLTFSRNFGHQVAITAGMQHARGQAAVVIDADLQDPPECIPALVERWRAGYEVVYGKRVARRGDSAFKRSTAALFYRLLNAVSEVPVPVDTGDFRLVDRKVLDVLNAMPERHRFVRGLVAWTGFRQVAVEFVRDGRAGGETKYSVGRMLALASDGVTSFSDRPLAIAGWAGVSLLAASLVALVAFLIADASGRHVAGWLVGVAAVAVLDALVLLALGVLGAYVARLTAEARGRPLFVLRSVWPASSTAAPRVPASHLGSPTPSARAVGP